MLGLSNCAHCYEGGNCDAASGFVMTDEVYPPLLFSSERSNSGVIVEILGRGDGDRTAA